MSVLVRNFDELKVYRAAFALQQAIFVMTQRYPKEELYSLNDQIRRASRSVGANIAEAWRKRKYEAHFLSKLTDSDAELAETQHWLKTSLACEYISESEFNAHLGDTEEIGRMLGKMMVDSSNWCRNYN